MGQAWRKDRLASEIVKETSRILIHEMRDPRRGFVTVTRAKVSDDYRYAKVFVSVMGTAKQKKLTLKGLSHAQGFVQKQLSRRIQMRSFPEINFEIDESIEKAFQVTKLIDDLAKKRKALEGGPALVEGGEEE